MCLSVNKNNVLSTCVKPPMEDTNLSTFRFKLKEAERMKNQPDQKEQESAGETEGDREEGVSEDPRQNPNNLEEERECQSPPVEYVKEEKRNYIRNEYSSSTEEDEIAPEEGAPSTSRLRKKKENKGKETQRDGTRTIKEKKKGGAASNRIP